MSHFVAVRPLELTAGNARLGKQTERRLQGEDTRWACLTQAAEVIFTQDKVPFCVDVQSAWTVTWSIEAINETSCPADVDGVEEEPQLGLPVSAAG